MDSEDGSEESADAAEDDDSKYEPLENVREDIRRSLANDRAVQHLSEVMESCYGKLQRVYNRYGRDLAASKDDETDPPEVPAELSDLSAMAKEYGLISEETTPLSGFELMETSVGKARDSQTQSQFVAGMAFRSLKLHEPALAVDLDGYQYLVIKVEELPDQTPPFKEIRDEVVERWKTAEAKKLALEKGKEIAKKAEGERPRSRRCDRRQGVRDRTHRFLQPDNFWHGTKYATRRWIERSAAAREYWASVP